MFLLIALLPVAVLLLFIYFLDKYKPEPWPELLKAFGAGVISAFIVLTIVLALNIQFSSNTSGAILDAFVNAAIPEELAKILMLWLVIRSNKYYDEYFDGIVYAVCVGMGFAGLENILYLFGEEDMMAVGMARGLISVPAHFLFAVAMGYYYSIVHFSKTITPNLMLFYKGCVVGVPILMHGFFDAFLMVASQKAEEMNYAVAGACILAFIAVCVFMVVFAFRKCKRMLAADKQYFDKLAKQQFEQYWNV